METTTLANEAIRSQLARIVSSATFQGARRAIRLLQYLVEQTLAGHASTLKEFSIGVDALGRKASFDPRTDSIARVEASRLRNRLDLYYAKEGTLDPVLIALPRGGYVPVFAPRTAIEARTVLDGKADDARALPRIEVASAVHPRRRLHLIVGALALLAVLAGIGVYSGLDSTPSPQSLAVLPFRSDLADGISRRRPDRKSNQQPIAPCQSARYGEIDRVQLQGHGN